MDLSQKTVAVTNMHVRYIDGQSDVVVEVLNEVMPGTFELERKFSMVLEGTFSHPKDPGLLQAVATKLQAL